MRRERRITSPSSPSRSLSRNRPAHRTGIAPTVIGDPDDDHALACALAAEAELIVTRDTRLLNLKHFQRIPIVLAAEAIRHIATA